jgi:glycerate kinase
MRVLVAPDKFKGSLSAVAVADSIARGLAQAGADTVTLPLADGGDGSVAAALASGMQSHTCTVNNAQGQPHRAAIALDPSRTAVIEVANTCGLSTLENGILAPMTASSYGFGQAIRHAVGLGARRLVLCLGGSASTDGGIGMLAALGYTFHDSDGKVLPPVTRHLNDIHEVRANHTRDLHGIEIVVASDVTSPLTGPSGAAAVYGPQKGATLADIDRLEDGIETLVSAMQRSTGPQASLWAHTPGAGAAGGCGFAALCLGARIVCGAHYFLDLLSFDKHLRGADLVITGEGRLDTQTLTGKLPVVVAERAAPTPAFAVVGRNDLDGQHAGPFTRIYTVADHTTTDTTKDPQETATCLTQIGTLIGQRLAHRSCIRIPGNRACWDGLEW